MDLMTIQRKNYGWADRASLYPSPVGSNNSEERAERIKDLVKKVNAKAPVKNRWGGQDYPIDVSDYGQYLSTLQTLSWVLRDVGYDASYLTRNGLHYSGSDYLGYSGLFDTKQGKIVALVAIGKDGRHFRFSRDASGLRVRKFDNVARAIAPLSSSGDSGSRPISDAMVKEIVRVMKTQSGLNPSDEQSLRRWGRVVQSKSLKPCGAGVLKSLLNLQFKRM
jgi:hypothetical protein